MSLEGLISEHEYVAFVDEAGCFGFPASATGGTPTPWTCLAAWLVRRRELPLFDERLTAMYAGWRFEHPEAGDFEVHTGEWVRKYDDVSKLAFKVRWRIIRQYLATLNEGPGELICVGVDKTRNRPNGFEPFDVAYAELVGAISDAAQSSTLIVSDEGHELKLRTLMAERLSTRLGFVNPEPAFENSTQSMRIQAADVAATFVYQYLAPHPIVRKIGGRPYLSRLADRARVVEDGIPLVLQP